MSTSDWSQVPPEAKRLLLELLDRRIKRLAAQGVPVYVTPDKP